MKTLRNLAILVGIILFLITSCNVVWSLVGRQNDLKDLLPEKLETVGSVLTADRNFLDTCFFAVYKLSDKTLSSINQEGLAFFKDATKSRAYYLKGHPNGMYDVYGQWKQTPVFNTFVFGTICADEKEFDKSLLEKIKLATHSKGSFYTAHSQGVLVVLPSLGIAVLSGPGD